MTTFTSSLPSDLLDDLAKMAKKHKIAKNKILEKALTIYLDQLNRAEYVRSYEEAGQDLEVMEVAEEGMSHYLENLENNML
ncbi:CopG family transcriptional regulator [Flavimarina sp. Hel_I_48]|uniref:CopG family transcriptional regulator n=1 Tax=Flavimarina sp. Hel_I_48 TaxID=1392488 RepID=UPI0004DFA3EB|nr:CopG family transcriptional regulator [Flavimarina sp. Hel_I_48]